MNRDIGGSMRAARVVRHGEPAQAVEVEDIPPPEVGPGTVRVAVAAASLNYGDIARCRGGVAAVMATPPFTLGMDVCGVVDTAGDAAEHWIGQRVVGITTMAMGGMAEYALVPVQSVFAAPPELDDAEAAAFILPFHLSQLALRRRARLEPGETLLVVGGASGVGTAAIQTGVAAGARVIASAGGTAKTDLCRRIGADVTIDSTADDLFEVVMAETKGRGADVVFDIVGGERTEAVWMAVAREGRYVAAGFNDDPLSGMTGRPLRRVATGNFSVIGVMLSYTDGGQELRRFGLNPFTPDDGKRIHEELLELVAAGRIRPVIGRRIGLDEVGAALEDHANRATSGRTVVELGR
jgi:NADPH:quinone reductase